MSKHTPGPWHVRPTSMKGQCLVAGGDLRSGDGFSLQFSTANAHLVAAAPDMLDFAQNVGGFDDRLLLSADLNMIRATLREWRDEARAAIAKAEGRS